MNPANDLSPSAASNRGSEATEVIVRLQRPVSQHVRFPCEGHE